MKKYSISDNYIKHVFCFYEKRMKWIKFIGQKCPN